MAKARRTFAILCVGIALVASVIVMATRPAHNDPSRAKDAVTNTDADKAIQKLVSQLQRRFHDQTNSAFGLSRVAPANARNHAGPISERLHVGSIDPKTKLGTIYAERQTVAGKRASLKMVAENAEERSAIESLLAANVEVAIYTVGFGPTLRHDGHTSYGSGFDAKTGARAKGPAYLADPSSPAPSAEQLVSFAKRVLEKGSTQTEQVKDGWRALAFRVDGDKPACIDCHNRMIGKASGDQGAFRLGSTLGVLVLALRDVQARK